jgi:polysaccharide deacetylase family protein (PEP-CTERM system associated)
MDTTTASHRAAGAHRSAGRPPTGIVNALTIDVEEYFHPNAMDGVVSPDRWDELPHRVEHNTYHVLDVLSEFQVTATFFVLGWVAERWPRLVAEIARRGHEVACHGYAHRLVYRLGPDAFRADVRRAKRTIEDCVGVRVAGFRAASYSVVADTLWALGILVEEGFDYDSSIFPIRHDIYGIPHFSRTPVRITCGAGEILEIPASTIHLFGRNWPLGGGGYFRLIPYAATRWGIDHLHRRDQEPAIVYVHPWELDPQQPRLKAGLMARFRQYTNLHRTEPRLRRLLRDFHFAPLRTLGWTTIRSLSLDSLRRAA